MTLDPLTPTHATDSRRESLLTLALLALLAAWVAASRWAYLSDILLLSKDGPLYAMSLTLNRGYCVPMPGNIGFVVLGRLASVIWADPTGAFGAVNIVLTFTGAAYVLLLGRQWFGLPLAAATALAFTTNPLVWWHGVTVNSYLVWLAILPALFFHVHRFVHTHATSDVVAASLVLGVGTMLRQDLVAFGGPLWLGGLLLGRASFRQCVLATAIVAICCLIWFAGTSVVLGGPQTYVARVAAKHEAHMAGYAPSRRGLFEGLVRNGSKLALFLVWAVPLVGPLAVVGILRRTRSDAAAPASVHEPAWRLGLLVLLAVGPSLTFSLGVFMGNAGLVFPLLSLVYLLAARGLAGRSSHAWRPAVAMLALAIASCLQFTAVRPLAENDQRRVIVNVTFLRDSGPGLRARMDWNLDDYHIDPSLASILRQMRQPGPVPRPKPLPSPARLSQHLQPTRPGGGT